MLRMLLPLVWVGFIVWWFSVRPVWWSGFRPSPERWRLHDFCRQRHKCPLSAQHCHAISGPRSELHTMLGILEIRSRDLYHYDQHEKNLQLMS